jgi:glycosyltransferase involved in cell wall biosynthesis
MSAVAAPGSVLPKISCLMVSKGELFPARFAIQCFRRQTYANRELVVLCDRPGNPVAALIARLGDPSIRYVETAPAPLGELRNRSVEAAAGDLVAQWDDDDLFHPHRLEFQQRALAASGAAAHFLSHWMLWWPRRRLLAVSSRRDYWEGSMLVRRDAVTRYPEVSSGEDTAMVTAMFERHDMTAANAPGLYCYIYHGSNTFNDEHWQSLFDATKRIVPDVRYDAAVDHMSAAMPLRDYAAALEMAKIAETEA